MIEIVKNQSVNEVREFRFDGNIRLLWNPMHKVIQYKDIDEEIEKELSEHKDTIVGVYKLDDSSFLTVSRDNCAKFWNKDGSLRGSFHSAHSIESIDINGSYIIFITLEGIKGFSFNAEELYSIDTKLASLENIKIDYFYIHILSDNSAQIYRKINGRFMYKLKNVTDFIREIKILSSGRMLSLAGDLISLWDEKEEKICDIHEKFDFEEIIEKEDTLIILTHEKKVIVLDGAGKILSSYQPKKKLLGLLQNLIQTRAKLDKFRVEKSKIEMFPHINNPYSKQTENIQAELERQKIDLESDIKKSMWRFFNRPILGSIIGILSDESNETDECLKRIDTESEDLKSKISKLKDSLSGSSSASTYGVIAALLFGGGIFMLMVLQQSLLAFSAMGISLLMLIMAFNESNKKKNIELEIKELESALQTLDEIKPVVDSLDSDISTYKWGLLSQIPNYQKLSKIVDDRINQLVDEDICTAALKYCGLTEDDIVSADKKPIILRDASLIQKNSEHLNRHNLLSFWKSSDGVAFAAQYIQYIFLSDKKIDVFSTHYDFIQDKFIRKESQAFYYKDVTNISKKEVDRELIIDNKLALATEVSLKVSSGDSIAITILNEDTFDKISSENESSQTENESTISQLTKELEIAKNKGDSDKVEVIEFQLEQLKIDDKKSFIEGTMQDKADKTVQNIRAQIHKYKS